MKRFRPLKKDYEKTVGQFDCKIRWSRIKRTCTNLTEQEKPPPAWDKLYKELIKWVKLLPGLIQIIFMLWHPEGNVTIPQKNKSTYCVQTNKES